MALHWTQSHEPVGTGHARWREWHQAPATAPAMALHWTIARAGWYWTRALARTAPDASDRTSYGTALDTIARAGWYWTRALARTALDASDRTSYGTALDNRTSRLEEDTRCRERRRTPATAPAMALHWTIARAGWYWTRALSRTAPDASDPPTSLGLSRLVGGNDASGIRGPAP